jgi:transcriptional regulator CtsR
MGISDKIEAFITELLKEEDDNAWLELRRNELASVFNCVPSQINYVISTRFTPQHGYIVESRRGGGGYLRIKRVDTENIIFRVMQSIGETLDLQTAKSYTTYLRNAGTIDDTAAKIILAAVSDESIRLAQKQRDTVRADIYKNILASME